MRKHNLKLVSDAEAIANETKSIKIKKGLILKKREDGRSPYWFAQIALTGIGTKFISTKSTDEKEATQKAYELQAKYKTEVKAGYTVFDKSFEKVALEYIEHRKMLLFNKQLSQSSFERDFNTINLHLIPYFKERKIGIGKFNKVIFENFRKWMLTLTHNGKPLKTTTRRKYEDILGSLLKWAEGIGYIKELPRLVRTKATATTQPSYTKEDFRKMMGKLKQYIELAPNKRDLESRQKMYYAVTVMAHSGLRPHELCRQPYKSADGKTEYRKGLKWSNVTFYKDDKNKKYSVDIYISPHIDKNSKERIVPANKVVYWILSKMWQKTTDIERKIGYVFDTDYRSAFPRFLKWAGIREHRSGENYKWYSLRHTKITWNIEDNPTLNPRQLSKVVGNSVATIEKYYDKSEIKNFRHNFID